MQRVPLLRVLRPAFAALAALALLAGGCGDDGGAGPSETSTSTSSSTTSTSSTSTSSTSSTSTTTSGPPPTTIPDDELPGDPFDLAPAAGRTLAVFGVDFDDELNVRAGPGTDREIVAGLAPLAADFVATGRARQLTSSIWWEIITADGVVGWVSSIFTAQIGPTSDATNQVVTALGEIPEEATMTDLGLLVAETLRTDPDIASDIVMSVAATEDGDLGEVTYDLVGIGDDAVRGYRLHVFGQPLESGDGFGLKTVESTDMCQAPRGPSEPEGICN